EKTLSKSIVEPGGNHRAHAPFHSGYLAHGGLVGCSARWRSCRAEQRALVEIRHDEAAAQKGDLPDPVVRPEQRRDHETTHPPDENRKQRNNATRETRAQNLAAEVDDGVAGSGDAEKTEHRVDGPKHI